MRKSSQKRELVTRVRAEHYGLCASGLRDVRTHASRIGSSRSCIAAIESKSTLCTESCTRPKPYAHFTAANATFNTSVYAVFSANTTG